MASLPFNDEAVRALAGILNDTGLTEIEIEGKEGRIRVVRAGTVVSAAVAAPAAVQAQAAHDTDDDNDDSGSDADSYEGSDTDGDDFDVAAAH